MFYDLTAARATGEDADITVSSEDADGEITITINEVGYEFGTEAGG